MANLKKCAALGVYAIPEKHQRNRIWRGQPATFKADHSGLQYKGKPTFRFGTGKTVRTGGRLYLKAQPLERRQQMKFLAAIQARCGSTRLPGKILMGLSGKPVLQRVIERLEESQFTDET